MGILGKLFSKKNDDSEMLTDDERELREYEENEYKPESRVDENSSAELIVESAMQRTDTDTLVMGSVTSGKFLVGDEVIIVSAMTDKTIHTVITELTKFTKPVESVSEGEKAGITLKDIRKDQIRRNDIIKKKESGGNNNGA